MDFGKWQKETVDQMASLFGISAETCHGILCDVLNVRHVCEYVLPRNILTSYNRRDYAVTIQYRFPILFTLAFHHVAAMSFISIGN